MTATSFGVPPSSGIFTCPVHPNPFHNRTADTRARCASPVPGLFVPDIAPRCSTANRSNDPCSRAAPGYDEPNSASPNDADLNASRVRPRGRKLFGRVPALRRSKRARCGRAANPTRAAKVVCQALRPARVMIRQHAPRKSLARARRKHSQQIARKLVHAFRAVADVIMMLKTRRRNEKTSMPEVGPMRRGMPWIAALLSPCEQLFTLLLAELTPEIAWCGHGMRLIPDRVNAELQTCSKSRLQALCRDATFPSPRKRGTPNFHSRNSFQSQEHWEKLVSL